MPPTPRRRTNSATSEVEKNARSRKSKKEHQSGAASVESIVRGETPWSSSRRRRGHGPESVRDSAGLEPELDGQETGRTFEIGSNAEPTDSDSTIRTTLEEVEGNDEVKRVEEMIDTYKRAKGFQNVDNGDHLLIYKCKYEGACACGWDCDTSVVSLDYLQGQKWEHTNWRFQATWHPDRGSRTHRTSFVVARNSPADFILAAKEWEWFKEAKTPKSLPRGGQPKSFVNGTKGSRSIPDHVDPPKPSPTLPAMLSSTPDTTADAVPEGLTTRVTGDVPSVPFSHISMLWTIPMLCTLCYGVLFLAFKSVLYVSCRVASMFTAVDPVVERSLPVALPLTVLFDLRKKLFPLVARFLG